MAYYNAIKYDGFSKGSLTLLSTTTASSDSTVSFTSGIDSTYKEYLFIFNNIHPSADTTDLDFQGSTDGGSSYGVTATTTCFTAQHDEADSSPGISYSGARDLGQATGFHGLSIDTGNANDECCAGFLHLFNPSSTTFVKHFISRVNSYHGSDYSIEAYGAGYFNTTSAIDAIQFKFDSGNIDAGTIQLIGIT